MCLFNLLTQVIGTPSAPQPLVPSREAGPSTAPIIVESSSSDEPMAPAPEPRITASQMKLEEIRFKEVRNLSALFSQFAITISRFIFLLYYFQEQNTPDNSLFSFAVALSDDEEVAPRQVTLSSIPDD